VFDGFDDIYAKQHHLTAFLIKKKIPLLWIYHEGNFQFGFPLCFVHVCYLSCHDNFTPQLLRTIRKHTLEQRYFPIVFITSIFTFVFPIALEANILLEGQGLKCRYLARYYLTVLHNTPNPF
jgi:hypothetical protein